MRGEWGIAPVHGAWIALTFLCASAPAADTEPPPAEVLDTVQVNEAAPPRSPGAPVSAQTLDAEAIDAAAQPELTSLQDAIPNLRLGLLGGRASQAIVSVRGFTNPYGAPQSAVLLRVDGIPVDDFYSFGERLFDIARIDVRKGPHGTTGGGGAEAGAIDILTRRPQQRAQAYLDARLASPGGYAVAASASGALSGELFATVAASKDGSDGYVDNLVGHRPFNGQDGANLRTRVLWKPDPRWEIDATLLARRVDDRGGEIYAPVDRGAFNALPSLAGARLGKFDLAVDEEGFNRLDSTLAGLSASVETEGAVWQARVSTRHNDVHNATDYDLSPQPWFVMDSRYRISQQSAELSAQSPASEATPWHWIAGLAGDRRDLDFLRVLHAGPGNSLQLPAGDYIRTDAQLGDLTAAAFAHARWRWREGSRWTLDTGLRKERAQRAVTFRANAIDPREAALRRVDTQFLPSAALSYALTADATVYASWSRGWKPGGYNTNAFSVETARYVPERATATEIGLQGGTASSRYALTLFHNAVRDYQDLVISEDALASYIVNAPRVRTRGLEAEWEWHAATAWSMGATLGTVQAQYIDAPIGPTAAFRLDGRRLENVPRWNGRAHLGYRHGAWRARVDVAAAGGFIVDGYNATADVFHEQAVPGYATLQASLGYHAATWSAELVGTNLANRRYFTTASFGFAQLAGFAGAVGNLAPPRTFGLQLRWTGTDGR